MSLQIANLSNISTSRCWYWSIILGYFEGILEPDWAGLLSYYCILVFYEGKGVFYLEREASLSGKRNADIFGYWEFSYNANEFWLENWD